MNYKRGIPTIRDYDEITSSELFHNMEDFSDNFLLEHSKHLYNYRWDKDPLHHWSRRLEYPFVFQYISSYLSKTRNAHYKILDAGSGVTFIPFYIYKSFKIVNVVCCDNNIINKDIFDNINRFSTKDILFDIGDLQKTNYEDCSFDIIYCISVLEHTRNYEHIINEFKRILKPSGILIITFDICINGNEDISIEEAQGLLNLLYTNFPQKHDKNKINLANNLSSTQIFTSEYLKKTIPSSVPHQGKVNIISLLKTWVKPFITDKWLKKTIEWFEPGLRKEIINKLSFIQRPVITNTTIWCEYFYKTY